MLVVQAFKNENIVSWTLRNIKTRDMNLVVGHIYREGNTCADRLTSHGISLQNFCQWDFVPSFVTRFFVQDRQCLPCYMFRQSLFCFSSVRLLMSSHGFCLVFICLFTESFDRGGVKDYSNLLALTLPLFFKKKIQFKILNTGKYTFFTMISNIKKWN